MSNLSCLLLSKEMTVKNLLLLSLLAGSKICKPQTVADFDGNIYNTITIGGQTWMKENLRTTHFSNGVAIPTATSPVAVDSTSLFQWVYNDDGSFINSYGRLYTWFTTVSNNNLCPIGWHIPGTLEWLTLSNYLGGDTLAGKKMKEAGLLHWLSTDPSVNNSSQFTGRPGGQRANPKGFSGLGTRASFWSSSSFGSDAFQRGICFTLYSNTGAFKNQFLEGLAVANCGMSVRCVMNNATGVETNNLEKETELFPNPFTHDLTINFKDQAIRTVLIYTEIGELVLQKKLLDKFNIVELNELESGAYILKIIEDNLIFQKKVIKK